MKTHSLDTHPDAEKVQIKLLRQASTSERLRRTFTMSSWILWLSKQAISKAHPTWSNRKVDLFFVEVHYGKKLASHLQAYLEKNNL
ncbi:MAG: hypothetical protein HYY62_01485 [Deltaproteobacteria bacterium]|nr:hypothetical protein [Deltaproteobacteria bacterium]